MPFLRFPRPLLTTIRDIILLATHAEKNDAMSTLAFSFTLSETGGIHATDGNGLSRHATQ